MRTFVVLYKIGYEIGHYWNGFFFQEMNGPAPPLSVTLLPTLCLTPGRGDPMNSYLSVHPYYWVQNKAPPRRLLIFELFFQPTSPPPPMLSWTLCLFIIPNFLFIPNSLFGIQEYVRL